VSGPVIALATNWVTIAAGAETTSIPSTFVLARDYHAGRVAIVGHDGLFTDDSIVQLVIALFDVNLIRWLNGGGKTPDEIEAVRQFVINGGELLLSGLGWSWPAYHAGSTLDDYPMTKMAAPYQAGWLEGGVVWCDSRLDFSAPFR
jgi:hypothetical protein